MKAMPHDIIRKLESALRGQLCVIQFFFTDLDILVPDGRICCCFVESSVLFCSSLKHDPFFMYPLAVLSHLRPRFAYILGHYGVARSQGGHQPAAAKPPLY